MIKLYALIKEAYFKEISDCTLEIPMVCYLSGKDGEVTVIFYEKKKDGSAVNGLQFIATFQPAGEIDTQFLLREPRKP